MVRWDVGVRSHVSSHVRFVSRVISTSTLHGKYFRLVSSTQSPTFGDSVAEIRGMLLSQKENIILRLCCHGNMGRLCFFGDWVAETRRLTYRNHGSIVLRYFGKRCPLTENQSPKVFSVYIKILNLSVRSRKENRQRPATRNHRYIGYLDRASRYKSVGQH